MSLEGRILGLDFFLLFFDGLEFKIVWRRVVNIIFLGYWGKFIVVRDKDKNKVLSLGVEVRIGVGLRIIVWEG